MFIVNWGDDRLPGRFWDKTVIVTEASIFPGPCWIWTAGLDRDGYGRFSWRGKTRGAHRVSLVELGSDIPDDLVPDHLCRIRNCVNPAHLEAVTTRANLMRGDTPAARNAAKTHCYRGHRLDRARPNGERYCGTCHAANAVAWRSANKDRAREIGRESMRRSRERARIA